MSVMYSIKLERDENSANVIMYLFKDEIPTDTFMVYTVTVDKDKLLDTLIAWYKFGAIPESVNFSSLKNQIETQWSKIQLM